MIQTTGQIFVHVIPKDRPHMCIPYMNRKFKDLSKSRGIISHYHHPLKDIYFKAAAGVMTCLKEKIHTNLFSPLQALPMINFLFLYLHYDNRFGSETMCTF